MHQHMYAHVEKHSFVRVTRFEMYMLKKFHPYMRHVHTCICHQRVNGARLAARRSAQYPRTIVHVSISTPMYL